MERFWVPHLPHIKSNILFEWRDRPLVGYSKWIIHSPMALLNFIGLCILTYKSIRLNVNNVKTGQLKVTSLLHTSNIHATK